MATTPSTTAQKVGSASGLMLSIFALGFAGLSKLMTSNVDVNTGQASGSFGDTISKGFAHGFMGIFGLVFAIAAGIFGVIAIVLALRGLVGKSSKSMIAAVVAVLLGAWATWIAYAVLVSLKG
jgi:hypothetical protein